MFREIKNREVIQKLNLRNLPESYVIFYQNHSKIEQFLKIIKEKLVYGFITYYKHCEKKLIESFKVMENL